MECCLVKGELMQLSGGRRGLKMHCRKGTMWVTVGDGADYLVQQGSFFEIKPGTTALAEALHPVELRLEAPSYEGTTIVPVAVHRDCSVLA